MVFFIFTAIIIFAVFFFWRIAVSLTATFPTLRGKRICLLIAHPDDEAMFFAPTLIALTKPELKNSIKILCFSTGNADNLGATRTKELTVSGLLLGLTSQADITCLDDPAFPDSQHVTWDANAVAKTLTRHLAPTPSSTNVDVLLTFDAAGVSGHANHTALHAGAHAFLRSLAPRKGGDGLVALYTLASTGLARKYSSVLDVGTTLVKWGLASGGAAARRKGKKQLPGAVVCVSGFKGYRRAQRAMVHAHQSQMRWFRWGWIGVSRYMVVNDLRREGV